MNSFVYFVCVYSTSAQLSGVHTHSGMWAPPRTQQVGKWQRITVVVAEIQKNANLNF